MDARQGVLELKDTILIADDERGIVDMMDAYFSSQYEVLTAYSGKEAIQKAAKQPDLILLDINMPGIDGLTVCQTIREYVSCPILFLTARIESADKINGFQAGADDYITKPYDLDELAARIAAHLRREQRRHSQSIVCFFGELVVDYSARTVTIHNKSITLSKREFDILELLSLNAGQVFDRERIYETVWGIDGDGNNDTVWSIFGKFGQSWRHIRLTVTLKQSGGAGINGAAEKYEPAAGVFPADPLWTADGGGAGLPAVGRMPTDLFSISFGRGKYQYWRRDNSASPADTGTIAAAGGDRDTFLPLEAERTDPNLA